MSMNEIENFVQGGIWTHDPWFTRPSLYHLSYLEHSYLEIPGMVSSTSDGGADIVHSQSSE